MVSMIVLLPACSWPANAPIILMQFSWSMKAAIWKHILKITRNDFASNNMFYSYLQLRPGADYHQLSRKGFRFVDSMQVKTLRRWVLQNQYLPIGRYSPEQHGGK